jgi:hypothetical protein
MPGIALAKTVKVIKFVTKDKATGTLSIHVDDQSVLIEGNSVLGTSLYTDKAMFTINHKDKTYCADSYDEIQTRIRRWLSDNAKSQQNASKGPGMGLKLTGETRTILGVKARKLIQMSNGKPIGEIWVSLDLVPPGLRAFGEKIRAMVSADYWEKRLPGLGLPEIIIFYGVPLKFVSEGQVVMQVQAIETTNSASSLQVPTGYSVGTCPKGSN